MEKVIWITESDYRDVIRFDSDHGSTGSVVYKIIPDSDNENSDEDDLESDGEDGFAVVLAFSRDITF
jgi:hypothetical protein